MKHLYKKVAEEMNLPVDVVEFAYKSYWKFIKKTIEELEQDGINNCTNHVDFMIGTKDLTITGITSTGEKITIFENGNFSKNFQ